jgi:uncharacterized protein
VRIEFDPIKDLVNQAKHGVSLEAAGRAAWDRAFIRLDQRRDYGELRVVAAVPIEGALHMVVLTPRGERVRIISVRRANRREERHYVAQANADDQT